MRNLTSTMYEIPAHANFTHAVPFQLSRLAWVSLVLILIPFALPTSTGVVTVMAQDPVKVTGPDAGPKTRDVFDWKTPALLLYKGCLDNFDDGKNDCKTQDLGETKITWHSELISRQNMVPTATIRFGPFNLKRQIRLSNRAEVSDTGSTTFRISVWARSGNYYEDRDGDGKKDFRAGVNPNLIKIAELREQLSGIDTLKTVYLTAQVPNVFTALQLRASIDQAPAVASSFPRECGSLPSGAQDLAWDEKCLQASVHPLTRLKLPWMVVGILYEPPGNCSWANVTGEHTQGTAFGLSKQTSRSRTLRDAGLFSAGKDYDTLTVEEISGRSGNLQARVKESGALFTDLGSPLDNEGNPQCNNPDVQVADRSASAGPGKGDMFILLKNPNILHWESSGTTGAALLSLNNELQLATFNADEIRTSSSFTNEEKSALLSLDPFVDKPRGMAPPAPRFVYLRTIGPLGKREAYQHRLNVGYEITGEDVTEAVRNTTNSVESDEPLNVAVNAVGTVWKAGASSVGFGGAGALIDSFISDITEENTITINIQYSSSSLFRKVSGTANIQQFFLKDTNREMTYGVYYDTFFGSFAIVDHPTGAGGVTDATLRSLPVFVWSLDEPTKAPDFRRLPVKMSVELRRLGMATIAKANPAQFQADTNQTLYIVKNINLKPIAQIWVNVARQK